MRRRGRLLDGLWRAVQLGEARIIRVMVLAAVLLVIMQLSVIRDPLQFYMAVAAKVEAPPLDMSTTVYPGVSVRSTAWQITLKAIPAAPIRIIQNGKVLATLAKGEQQITVQSGQFQLDGSSVPQAVMVQVIQRDKSLLEPRLNQITLVQGNIQNITVSQ